MIQLAPVLDYEIKLCNKRSPFHNNVFTGLMWLCNYDWHLVAEWKGNVYVTLLLLKDCSLAYKASKQAIRGTISSVKMDLESNLQYVTNWNKAYDKAYWLSDFPLFLFFYTIRAGQGRIYLQINIFRISKLIEIKEVHTTDSASKDLKLKLDLRIYLKADQDPWLDHVTSVNDFN